MGKLELLCEEFGHKLLPLPPYSPEYNPIEKTWAHIKKHLKKVLPSCKALYWDGQGFWLLYKRFENGRLTWPSTEKDVKALTPEQVDWLMKGFSITPQI
ncbi:Mobile element protein [Streptococcus pneumoniae]|nr:Mobile element protein [Streptococcus pneumoniae]